MFFFCFFTQLHKSRVVSSSVSFFRNIYIMKPLGLFVLCSTIHVSSQLFRFCHRGEWHQLLEHDCPFGLLFNEQIQSPCYYTTGLDVTTPRIWATLCQQPYMIGNQNVTDATKDDDFFLAQRNGEIRMVQYGITDDNAKPSNYDETTTLELCEDACYRGVMEDSSHEASDSLEAPNKVVKVTGNALEAITDQTLRLGEYLFDQIKQSDENPGPKLRTVELFKKSIKIMGKLCQHPFISNNFLNRVLYGFLFLLSDSGIGDVQDINIEEFEEIMVALNACEEKNPEFRLEGNVCQNNAIVKEVVKIAPNGTEYTAPFLLTKYNAPATGESFDPDYEDEVSRYSKKFPYDQFDVFAEAAWSAVQTTHASCFGHFKPNANMHHRYVSAMEQLFSGKILDRWRNPTRLIDDRLWGTWFLADVDLTFVNIQACVRASYFDAPFSSRLDRPIDPSRSHEGTRKKRDVSEDSLLRYWDTYESSGGIRYMMQDQVECFQNPDDREAALGLVKHCS